MVHSVTNTDIVCIYISHTLSEACKEFSFHRWSQTILDYHYALNNKISPSFPEGGEEGESRLAAASEPCTHSSPCPHPVGGAKTIYGS